MSAAGLRYQATIGGVDGSGYRMNEDTFRIAMAVVREELEMDCVSTDSLKDTVDLVKFKIHNPCVVSMAGKHRRAHLESIYAQLIQACLSVSFWFFSIYALLTA